MSINVVTLVGRLTKDVELRKTGSGTSVASFTLACNRDFGKEEQEADFINCVVWRQGADFLNNYTHKGDLIGLVGRIQTRNYKDQHDKTVYVTEVVADRVKKLAESDKNKGEANTPNQQQSATGIDYNTPGVPFKIDDSDLPF